MTDLWKDSVCSACGKAKCFGTCPGYADWERIFLEADREMKQQSRICDEISQETLDEITRELDKVTCRLPKKKQQKS